MTSRVEAGCMCSIGLQILVAICTCGVVFCVHTKFCSWWSNLVLVPIWYLIWMIVLLAVLINCYVILTASRSISTAIAIHTSLRAPSPDCSTRWKFSCSKFNYGMMIYGSSDYLASFFSSGIHSFSKVIIAVPTSWRMCPVQNIFMPHALFFSLIN
jgi:hypothetical protein